MWYIHCIYIMWVCVYTDTTKFGVGESRAGHTVSLSVEVTAAVADDPVCHTLQPPAVTHATVPTTTTTSISGTTAAAPQPTSGRSSRGMQNRSCENGGST